MKAVSASLALLALALGCAPAAAQQPLPPVQQHCPLSYGSIDAAKSNTLYLYFPKAADTTFYSGKKSDWLPVPVFDAGALKVQGSTAQLIDAIHTVVADDYCEFNVQVKSVTSDPETSLSGSQLPARRTTVAIGADSNFFGLWGQAPDPVMGGTNPGHARVWAGYYNKCEGGDYSGTITGTCPPPLPGDLTGANATVLRWALAIGGTAAHEAGHTYGLAHNNENPEIDPGNDPGPPPLPGEDDYHHHLMPAGYNITPDDRVNYRRHFGDVTFGLLATNVGLSVQTMQNWDLVNPNQAAGYSLSIEFFSSGPTVSVGWSFNGAESPWINPTVDTGSAGPGSLYTHTITWSTPNPSYPGTAGVVAGGARFHIGASFTGVDFNQPDAITIRNVTLRDAQGNALTLHPRLPMYDTGTVANGNYSLNIYTPPNGAPMWLRSARIYQLPRLASIESMIGSGQPRTFDGLRIKPWKSTSCRPGSLADGRHCVFARREDLPHVLVLHRLGERGVVDCSRRVVTLPRGGEPPVEREPRMPMRPVEPPPGGGPKDSPFPPDDDGAVCAGIQRDPFPSATVYMIASFVDPKARHYDPVRRRYVVGPVVSKVFYQFAGVRDPAQLWRHQPDQGHHRHHRDRDRDCEEDRDRDRDRRHDSDDDGDRDR